MTDAVPPSAAFGPDRPLRLGTRASPLALAQARLTAAALRHAHGWPEATVAIVPMTATGDRVTDRPLADIGGKALWTRELDRALADGRIDAAVHSLKDVETWRPPELTLAAMLPRADVRDVLVTAGHVPGVGADGALPGGIAALPPGARVGTSSARRAAQLKALRPDLATPLLRGNVQTRLARLADGAMEATLLAAAGLDRLGLSLGTRIDTATLLPAASQGAIGVETLAGMRAVARCLDAIDHRPTRRAVLVERAFLAALGGDCRSPVAAHAAPTPDGAEGAVTLRAVLFAPDGTEQLADAIAVPADDILAPADLARRMLAAASPALAALFPGAR